VDEGYEDEPDKGCDKKADPEKLDRFYHKATPPKQPTPVVNPQKP
jgi:hypothetical protein